MVYLATCTIKSTKCRYIPYVDPMGIVRVFLGSYQLPLTLIAFGPWLLAIPDQ